ncbi:MAG: T9SS type A sorting domain-containing protein [Bacteroidales bacterium]|nr:T9SS type A sorting domain-containing protein [Bacteroidales bacterium]
MKKKILLTMMILSFFGMARVNYLNAQNVAKVGETEYASIEEAIANWTNNTTLTLLQNVELTDVIILKSTEYHVLDLGSYIMTAASGKDAIQIENCGRSSASYALDINADPNNTGGIVANGKAIVRTAGKSGVKDRPIIRFYNGVFNASYVAYHTGSNGTNCPQFYFYNGVFNGTVYSNRTLNQFYGGTFNGSLMMSVDSSAYTLVRAGRFKQLSNLFMSALNSGKFTIGSSKGVYDVGIYVDNEGYYVVGGDVITEAGETYQASINKTYETNDYLYYSSATENGLYYTNAELCLENNNTASSVVNVYIDQLDLTSLNYKGTININNTLMIAFNEGTTPAWTVTADGNEVSYTDVVANGKVIRTYVPTTPVAQIGTETYPTLAAAVEAAEDNQTITILRDAEGSGVVINKSLTIDFNTYTYTFVSPAVGSNGTQTQGFQILKDNTVVLKNGTLNVAEMAGEDFAMLIQNYADLTITDMTLDGDHLDRNNYSYVLSNNCGNVTINGNTNIKANVVEGEEHFAFDSYDYSSQGYALPTVTVNTTGDITGAVEVSATLNINGMGENSDITYIAIEGRGQLFHNGLTTTIKKSIIGVSEEGKDGWYSITSPIEGVVDHSKVEGLINGTHDLYYYNETEMMWENVKDNEDNIFTTLISGQGYLYANTADTDLLFNGALNNGVVTREVKVTEGISLSGFNLIGNPFTHNISKANMANITLAEGFYILSNSGAWVAKNESDVIAPMQGVLVQAAEAGYLLIKRESDARRSENEDNGQIKINVANSQYNDVAYVSFNEGLGLDKIPHRNAEIPMVYIPVDGINYAIATMSNDVTEIPVSFKAATIGEYTIGAEAQGRDYLTMTLVDRLTGIETNLMLEDYTFIAKSNDNEERFFIRLGNSQQSTDNSHFAYITNGMISIDHIEGQGMLNIYDIIGRPVAEYNVATSANISTADFAAGVYIIRMSDENGVKVQKIVVE